MRNMGGLAQGDAVTFWVYADRRTSLSVLFAGWFLSEDEILAAAYHGQPALFIILVVFAFLTAFYMDGVGDGLFGKPRSTAAEGSSESPKVMTIPMIILAGLSVIGVALNLPCSHVGALA
jgi:NADH-quinone oxidoreductase subunit L